MTVAADGEAGSLPSRQDGDVRGNVLKSKNVVPDASFSLHASLATLLVSKRSSFADIQFSTLS